MKQAFISSIVLSMALTTSAFAQTSAATAPAAPAAAAASAAAPAAGANATVTAEAPKTNPVTIKYVGIYEGPNFTTDGNNMHGEDTSVSNRPQIQYNVNENVNVGIQPRLNTAFTKDGVVAQNETWRLYGTFKNVASYGIVSLDIIPRIQLPTSKAAHNKTMTVSPDLIAAFNITPKDSRFTFDYTPEVLGYIYTDDAISSSFGEKAKTFIILHSLEGSYQLGASSQLTFGWYPEYNISKATKFTQDSNEVDVGVNFDVAKGWAINPYVGMEPVGMGANGASALKSMEAALVVSGTFL